MQPSDSAPPRLLMQQEISPSRIDTDAAEQIWLHLCDHLQGILPEQAFATWFRPIRPVGFDRQTLSVQVPSRFYYDWIEGHYAPLLEKALDETLGRDGRLVYLLPDKDDGDGFDAQPITVRENPVSATMTGHETSPSGLNPRYRFDTFIEGPPNRFARAAALAVSRSPGTTSYNPLLIYGGVGLGKTHLLQAIGHETQRVSPRHRVLYISSERFTQDFVDSIKKNRADVFSQRYRAVDLLLVDDVQFLVGRERTQMEFFHTFNALHQDGKQIVLTSDKPPRELDGLDERLVSRFGWGLVCDIGPPDYDTRIAIIQTYAEEEGVSLDPEISDYLAQHFTRNVRELQGALVRLVAHASLSGTDLTLSLARQALHDLIDQRERRVDLDLVQRVVADHFNVPPDLLAAKIRTQQIARVRMIAMALSLRLTGLSLKQVGIHFGKRDHTTVLHARQRVREWMEKDPEFSATIEKLISRIENESE